MRTSDIYKICNMGEGFLAVMAKPKTGDGLEQEFTGIAHYGIKIVVSLLEPDEADRLGLGNEALFCQRHGIHFVSFPIQDFGLPPGAEQVARLTKDLHIQIQQGNSVVIHCKGGIGRSGTISACLLLHEGYSPQEAFHLISTQRGVQVPDTDAQQQWVLDNHLQILDYAKNGVDMT